MSTATWREIAGGVFYAGVLGGALTGLLGFVSLAALAVAIGSAAFVFRFWLIRCPNCGARTGIGRYNGATDADHDHCLDCGFDLTTRWGHGDSPVLAGGKLWRGLGILVWWLVIALTLFRAWDDYFVKDKCLDAGGRIGSAGRCEH